eukprot:EG_transcript_14499
MGSRVHFVVKAAQLQAESIVCRWAVQSVFGPSPVQQGLDLRRTYWQNRLRRPGIHMFRKVDVSKKLEELSNPDHSRSLIAYPIIYDFNLGLLARFTEEYLELHNDEEACNDPLSHGVTAKEILQHVANCSTGAETLRYPLTLDFLNRWSEGFWVKRLRKQFPDYFPADTLFVCRELQPTEQRVLEIIAKQAELEVQYVEKDPALKDMTEDEEEEDSSADAKAKPGLVTPSAKQLRYLAIHMAILLVLFSVLRSRPGPGVQQASPRRVQPEEAAQSDRAALPPNSHPRPRQIVPQEEPPAEEPPRAGPRRLQYPSVGEGPTETSYVAAPKPLRAA